MRQGKVVNRSQRTLPFVRREIWQTLPAEQQRRCRELCAQLLRAVMEHEEACNGEENNER